MGRFWWKSVHLAWASRLIYSRDFCRVNYSQAQWCVHLVVQHDTDIFWWSSLQNSEPACFTPAFNHWLLWCKPGRFSAEWGTLEILLAGAGFLSSLPRSSGSPFVLEGSWVSSPELIHQICHIWLKKKNNPSAYLLNRTRPGLLFHRKIWKGNRKLSFWVILQESGLLGRVGGRLCSPRCYSYLHPLWERGKLNQQQTEFLLL